MKEASGELSMTAVAVVAIAAVGVLFATVIWPNISSSLKHSQRCSAAYGCTNCADGKCTCYYEDENGKDKTITCDDPNTKNTGTKNTGN